MYQTVPISELRTDRLPVSDSDISALAKHINDHGLQVPILVRGDMFVVDGHRRTAAMSLLGFTEIDVFIPETFVEATEHLRKTLANTNEALPAKPRRRYEIKRDLMPVVWMERGRSNKGIRRGDARPPISITGHGAVHMLAEVFGVSYSNMSVVGRVFGTETALPTTVDPKLFQEALEGLNEGTVRPGTVIAMLDQSKLFKGTIKGATDQRDALRGAVAAINGVLNGLAALGPLHKSISHDELFELRSALQRARRMTSQMINAVTEEMHHR